MKGPHLRKGRPRPRSSYFVPVPHGLEPVLLAELESLGLAEPRTVDGGAYFTGTLEDCYRANLWLRSGSRVLQILRVFPCPDQRALYNQVREIDWFRHLSPEQTLAVRVRLGRTHFTHAQYLARRIKDGVVDQFRETFGRRPSVDKDSPSLRIQAWIEGAECTLSLDSSDAALFQRGYRQVLGPAPLKENLAAGLIMAAGWKGDVPFYDFMTGSGTLPIEAALIAANRAPGLTRSRFGFQSWPDYQPAAWQRILAEARAAVRPVPVVIAAGDGDPAMVAQARANAEAAGVGEDIRFHEGDFRSLPPLDPPGTVLVNPPYGERMGQELDLPALYKDLGDVLKQRCKGSDAFVFTAQGDLIKSVGLRASRRQILYNGPLECRLLHYKIY